MPRKQEWTVRVVNPTPYRPGRAIGSVQLPGLWVEQMRRLGYLSELKSYDGKHTCVCRHDIDMHKRDASGAHPCTYNGCGCTNADPQDNMSQILELRCPDPRGLDSKVWAEMNAERMRSFGINAAAAPKWEA